MSVKRIGASSFPLRRSNTVRHLRRKAQGILTRRSCRSRLEDRDRKSGNRRDRRRSDDFRKRSLHDERFHLLRPPCLAQVRVPPGNFGAHAQPTVRLRISSRGQRSSGRSSSAMRRSAWLAEQNRCRWRRTSSAESDGARHSARHRRWRTSCGRGSPIPTSGSEWRRPRRTWPRGTSSIADAWTSSR